MIESRLLQLTENAMRQGRLLGRKIRLPRTEQLVHHLKALAPTKTASPMPVPSPPPTPHAAPPTPPPPSPNPAPQSDKAAALAAFAAEISHCTRCPHLASHRTQVVFGVGNPDAEIMFIGEAPGAEEDRLGEPFVGPAGTLLTKVIQTMGLERDAVYIANVLKCRPDLPPDTSGNRPPSPTEMATCLPYLERQIAIIQPRVLITLGATALNGLLGGNRTVGSSRGQWLDYQQNQRKIPVRPTYHPAYILRRNTIAEKRLWWEDMLAVLEHLGHPITARQRAFFQTR